MRRLGTADHRVYLLVGLATIGLFAVGLGVLAWTRPEAVSPGRVAPFVAGFLLFMGVYFVSYAIRRVETAE